MTEKISTAAGKARMSNMELLRIVAMMMVLVVHADFWLIGVPTARQLTSDPLPAWTKIFIESGAIGCVDLFVLISGWFGIRPTWRGVGKLVFQSLFIVTLVYVAFWLTGQAVPTWADVAEILMVAEGSIWFVKAYLVLMILAPVLNAFVEHVDRRTLGATVALGLGFQTIFGWVTNGAAFFNAGYSPLSFAFLYLLARYARRYPSRLTRMGFGRSMLTYVGLTLLTTALMGLFIYVGQRGLAARMYSYVSPLVIFGALYLLLAFSQLRFRSRWINFVGASSFSVYLLHTTPVFAYACFRDPLLSIYKSLSGPLCLLAMAGVLTAIFALAIAVDQLRLFCWNRLEKCFPKPRPRALQADQTSDVIASEGK